MSSGGGGRVCAHIAMRPRNSIILFLVLSLSMFFLVVTRQRYAYRP